MVNKKFTFVGCSLTVGVGLSKEKNDSSNYTNIISNKYAAKIKNLAIEGNSNYNIFIDSLNKLINDPPDKLFVQWSALNRLWVYPGPDTKLCLSHTIKNDYVYKNLYFSKKDLQKLTDTYHLMNHDYHSLRVLINYCKILETVAKSRTQIIFINGLVPWTSEICVIETTCDYMKNFSDYTKQILELDCRDDQELNKLFVVLCKEINSLNFDNWPNMFESFRDLAVDRGNDRRHPGPASHKLYANKIIDHLENHYE